MTTDTTYGVVFRLPRFPRKEHLIKDLTKDQAQATAWVATTEGYLDVKVVKVA